MGREPFAGLKGGGYTVKRATLLLAAGLLFCLPGFGGGQGVGQTVYEYQQTLLREGFGIECLLKTVYAPGEVRLYYRGFELKERCDKIICLDAAGKDLGRQFEAVAEETVLTIRADFSSRISGLVVEEDGGRLIIRLRALDSPQFAWQADVFVYDVGMMTEEKWNYAAEDPREPGGEGPTEEQRESLKNFALLQGLWTAGDGRRKYAFRLDPDKGQLLLEELWYDDVRRGWNYAPRMTAGSARKTASGLNCDEAGREMPQAVGICLISIDPAMKEKVILYSPDTSFAPGKQVIRVDGRFYYRDAP